MPGRLQKATRRIVGTKQTIKALQAPEPPCVVYIAADADAAVVAPVRELCRRRGIEVVVVESMGALGRLCAIDVGAAAVAIY